MADHVDWLLVGTSDIARKRVASALASARGGRLVGICGGRDRAEAIAGEHNVPEVYDNLREAVATTRAQAVYVTTPVDRHVDEAIVALEAGKHVLVEKPLAVSGADADRIVRAAAAVNVRSGCAYYRRCFPRYAHLRRTLSDGEFGDVVLVSMAYRSWYNPEPGSPRHWHVIKARSGGGPLPDMGSHMFDLLIGLFGLPLRVFARVQTRVQPYEVEDSSAIVMQLTNGAQVIATFGWNSQTWAHVFEVVGSSAAIKWEPADAGKVTKTVGRDVEQLDMPNADNVHVPLVEDFNRAVLEGHDPIVPIPEAAKTNTLLDAIYRSAESGREVSP